MNKRGDQELKSTHRITMRLTEDEFNMIKTCSMEERLSASEYCRTKIFPATHKKASRDIFIELQKMNESLSDTYSLYKKILRAANADPGFDKDILSEARGALQELSAIAGNVYSAIRNQEP